MHTEIKNKVVVITGASSGIGETTARMLAAHEAKVVLVARRKDRIDNLARELGERALAIKGDVTNSKDCQAVVDATLKRWDRIDVLINNAGVMLLGPALEAPLEEWERMVSVNLMGLLYMTHAAIPIFKKQGTGHIVNISSVAGRTTSSGSAVYNATKWGVNAFTDGLRQELAASKLAVKTTLIEPGAVATELRSHNRPEVQEMVKKRIGDITILQSEDIARGIVYALDQPAHVTINEVLIRPTKQAL